MNRVIYGMGGPILPIVRYFRIMHIYADKQCHQKRNTVLINKNTPFPFLHGSMALVGLGLLTVEGSRTQANHIGWDSSGRVICPSQGPVLDNIRYSQQTSMPPGRIRTRNPSKRAAAEPSHRPRGHRDRQITAVIHIIHKYN